MAEPPCPATAQLQQLIDAATPDEALITHVGQCAGCQRRLEQLAGASSDLLTAAQGLRHNAHLAETARQRVLEGLEADVTLTGPAAARMTSAWLQSLLQPTAVPGAIGLFGRYPVYKILGQGGMGVVLEADDPDLGRRVAIKFLSPELANDPVSRERFAREARAAAAVRHENVVVIHAVSDLNGLPYIVMEYVAGRSLQDLLDDQGALDWQTAARLGAEIAAGLAAAHSRGLIHRDIKPSNILLQPAGYPPPGGARICDFGLARVAEESRLTRTGVIAGTPMYMAPEQALCDPLDHRADLFSLGSVLYAACTGRTPFPDGSPLAVLRQVADTPSRPVRELAPAVPAWLEAVIARLQAKRPADRFASAQEVVDLLRHNLAHPYRPRFPSPRRTRPSRRTLALAAGTLVLLGLALGLWLWTQGDRHAERPPLMATLQGHDGLIWAAAFSPDGLLIATGSDDTTLRLWDAGTGAERAVLTRGGSSVVAATFARSGEFLLSGHGDGSVHLWDAASGKELPGIPRSGGSGRRLALSPDDRTLAAGSVTQGAELWDVEGRKLRRTLSRRGGTVFTLAFAPDGKTLATGDTGGSIRLWDPATGEERAEFRGDSLRMRALAFTPDGRTLISAGTGDDEVKLWDAATHRQVGSLPGYESEVTSMAVSPDGRFLATGGRDGVVKLWELAAREPLATWAGHRGGVWGLSFRNDGGVLVTAGEDRLGRLWDLDGFAGGSR